MARIIQFPRPRRRVPPSASASAPPPPRTDRPGEEWLGPVICGALGALFIPLALFGVLLWPVLVCVVGFYLIGLLIGMLLGGLKWLLIGLVHFALLGVLVYVCGAAKTK